MQVDLSYRSLPNQDRAPTSEPHQNKILDIACSLLPLAVLWTPVARGAIIVDAFSSTYHSFQDLCNEKDPLMVHLLTLKTGYHITTIALSIIFPGAYLVAAHVTSIFTEIKDIAVAENPWDNLMPRLGKIALTSLFLGAVIAGGSEIIVISLIAQGALEAYRSWEFYHQDRKLDCLVNAILVGVRVKAALPHINVINTIWRGSVSTSRTYLGSQCDNNKKVLAQYDKTTRKWVMHREFVDSEWDLDKALEAVRYSAEKHNGQFRKDAAHTPYIVHPIGVADLAWDVGVTDHDVAVSALLHDTLEDTTATPQEIESRFGSKVLAIVTDLTNDPNLSGAENKQRQIDHAPYMLPAAKIVKLADRLYNITDLEENPPPSWSAAKKLDYFGWAEKLVNALRGTNIFLETLIMQKVRANTGSAVSG